MSALSVDEERLEQENTASWEYSADIKSKPELHVQSASKVQMIFTNKWLPGSINTDIFFCLG